MRAARPRWRGPWWSIITPPEAAGTGVLGGMVLGGILDVDKDFD